MRRIAVGQAGGPTAVINTSLVGLIDALYGQVDIYTVWNGYQGLVDNDMELLDESLFDWIKKHEHVPGACLGSGRYPFTPELMERAVLQLKQRDIHSLIFIGGNGTMTALHLMSEMANAMQYELQVIGIPKTVDNDLACTDHAPGFASAARYVALTARDISKDLEAMRNFEQVRIIETMGRHTGWLALSSGFLKASEDMGPHHIYLPERPIEAGTFLMDVQQSVQAVGMATIVVSEGFTFIGEDLVEREVVNGRSVLGGIAAQMEQLTRERLGYTVRSENMGMHQRSANCAVSAQDRIEAYETGQKAATFLLSGKSNVMVSIQRLLGKGYTYVLEERMLGDIAEYGERSLPDSFISNPAQFYTWLAPIIGDPIVDYPSMRKRSNVC
ncbi:diphosphate--fructose-6-phosphate 1-phosphotransferase [Paenibacillus sp. PL2-23]|uniref:diphosphate--fructose-6-phosphate 1-phosphotransferase n=1 Tax=Paenibacillus sp. PL2-23 TaxID=2100729 RepID=UPI0030F89CEB